ncbi:protein-glutamate methylesterase/protein-glutamine glutaminase [Simiduia agarivorans]|uniref:protein-glutamate methylesterase/protein-glutamine glutaminase n=1 Tax=Simiduia agarivorans TaxID=447471 RepID=UPI0004626B16|nr:chemotaxis response regulator protein-glutamate methylesterase [Simiduia agarivorans]
MVIKVLIVDDSNFFQQRLTEIINADARFKVVGKASNGREGVEKARALKPDVITMDYEMPMMDGVTAVRQIMAENPTPILMFSSLTYEGARTTLDALDAGAVDFLPKNFSEVSSNSAALKAKLHQKLAQIARKTAATQTPMVKPVDVPKVANIKGQIRLVVIGASTGGPLAVTEVVRNLPANFPLPVILVLHMPENFTRAFAERLDKQSRVKVKEATDNDLLVPGTVLLAPGGKQTILHPVNKQTISVIDGDDRVNYKPCVDITLASAAKAQGAGLLGVIMTGMGSDGRDGARLVKQQRGHIWTQDEDSCVIYGMPQAVVREGLSDRVCKLAELSRLLSTEL